MAEPELHEQLVSAVLAATGEVFSTMLGLEAMPRDAYKDRHSPRASEGVVSLIGLAGQWVGTGSLSCSAELACKISSHLLMTEYEAVNEEVLDAVAEVTNMIVGNVKTVMEEQLGPLGLSIPTVVFGRNFTTLTSGHSDWTVVPFALGQEQFEVHVCLTRARTEARPGVPAQHAVGA